MHPAAGVLLWLVFVLACTLLVVNLARLIAPRGTPRSQLRLGRCWLALFVLVEAVPRLAGWPSGVVLALSVLAFAPLLLAVRALRQR